MRSRIINQLRTITAYTLPDHFLELFGSQRTGLAFATSDLDLRLVVSKRFEDHRLKKTVPPEPEQKEGLQYLTFLLHNNLKHQKQYHNRQILHARYPLISLRHHPSGLDIQIVLANDTSLSRGFIKTYLEQYPYLHELFFVVKAMLKGRGLTQVFNGGFGSYTIFMMIVASIKLHPHSRNDSAGALLNFLELYGDPKITGKGIAIEPAPRTFDKEEEPVMTVKVKTAVEVIY